MNKKLRDWSLGHTPASGHGCRKGDIVDVLTAVEDFLLAEATYRGRQTPMAEGVLRVAR
jgi:hypothetical protein